MLEEKKNEKTQRAARKIRFGGENILRQAGRQGSMLGRGQWTYLFGMEPEGDKDRVWALLGRAAVWHPGEVNGAGE
jgi:hypothetical protein